MVDVYSEDFLNSLDIPFNFNISLVLGDRLQQGNMTLQENESLADFDERKYEKALLNYYLMGIAGTTVCFMGIICNILSVIVLTRRVMNSSTYSYLSSLAVCDTMALFLTVIIFLLSEDTKYPQRGRMSWVKPIYAVLFPYLHPAAVTFQVTSIWLTLAFTVDRYIMICHPFAAERMCSVGRARKVICIIYILGVLFNIPRFLEYTTEEIEVPSLVGGVERHLIVQYTDTGSSQLFMDLVHSYLYLTFVCGIPFLTLAILNTFLIHAVHLSKKNGRLINAKEKKRNDTTVMLIGVIVIFLVCQGPALISRMVYAIDFDKATGSMTFHKINEAGNFLIIVNSAVNIVPYYFFGKRFRREFWRLFCMCCLSQQELRKMKRSLSFSVDNRRRISQCSVASLHELNGFSVKDDQLVVNRHRSCSPLFVSTENSKRESIQTTYTLDNDRLSHSSLDKMKRRHSRLNSLPSRSASLTFDKIKQASSDPLSCVTLKKELLSLNKLKKENSAPNISAASRKEIPASLKVIWALDEKNEKCNHMKTNYVTSEAL